ncbi:MAG: hypothetical protein ABI051_03915 [Vicinamibacterales bacterium]
MSPQHDIPEIDTALPITMLPVRIETRFAGTLAAPQLHVRIYPDDLHVDHHDSRLTGGEVAAGRRYWTSIRAGSASDQAWNQLLKDVGPSRAIWVREALTPANTTGAPTFTDPATVEGTAGIAAAARALPGSFIVRARYDGGETTVRGGAIPEHLQVGVSFGDALPGATPAPAVADDMTLVLDEGMRWMVDFDAAVAVGMAVTIDLPPQTNFVRDVVVVGVPVAGANGAALLAALIESHRLSDGAAFLPPGTPTNNLADSRSTFSITAVPQPGPVTRPVDGSVAAVLAAAWSVDAMVLAPIDGASSRELDEARLMGRALFEATWGSYLRQQAQPGFDLNLLPQVFAHVTSFVRGGGPLPAIRLGRQPYAIAPVMARGTWAPVAESAFQQWLSEFLPRIRALWISGIADAPSGPDLFSHEPVSTRVRLRTTNMSAAVDYMVAMGSAVVDGNRDLSRRRLLAELGFTSAMPSVFTQLFPKGAAHLWLPMAADDDTHFDILAPAPKDANSVLGLLLRNSALRIAANATHEFAGLAAGQPAAEVAHAMRTMPIANLPAAAGRAIPVLSGFAAATTIATPQSQALGTGKDASGTAFTIRDRLADIVGNATAFAPDYGRYFNSDALAAFRDALKSLDGLSTDRRAVLAGEILDCASHRYDAWVTSLAIARLAGMQATKRGNQVGAWGAVRGIQRRQVTNLPASDTIPEGTVADVLNGGFVMAPSPRQASAAAVVRAAWLAHGGASNGALAPFAMGLTSMAVRRALTIAEGMRNGQQLGALLGYLLERGIHDASGVDGIEIDWVVFELRRQYPLRVDTIDNAPQASSERLVADGWKLAQVETTTPGAVVAAFAAPVGTGQPTFGPAEKTAVQVVIADVVATLDAFTDLGLAESMYQLAGANLERAAAVTDMLGRAASPPDVFESVATPRSGRGIEQRVVVTFGPGARPPGYATNTPRARLAPAADAFVARRLGLLGDVRVRLLDLSGAQIAAPTLSSLGLSALDLAALDLSSEHVTLSSIESPETMPGAPNSNPGRPGVMRLLLAAGQPDAATVDFDLSLDADLLDLLDHAAAWQRVLAGRKPLTADTFVARAALTSLADASGLAVTVASLATELGAASTSALKAWGIGGDAAAARAAADSRLAAAAAIADPVRAAGVLLGGPAVVEGSLAALPPDIRTTIGDQPSVLGPRTGVLARWFQDSARVRSVIASLNDALLRDDLAGSSAVQSWAAQTPATPYVETVNAASAHAWVGAPFPAALGSAPVTSVVIVGDDASGAVTGVEVDAWTEVVPSPAGTSAVAANISAPDARAPNLILMAVPPDVTKPWTQESLLSVVDEALELADCRIVDFDATRRVPALLPAIYLADFDEDDLGFRRFLNVADKFPARWVAKETP